MRAFPKLIAIVLGFTMFGAAMARAQSFIWAKQISSSSATAGNKVVADSSGNVYITGGFSKSIGFGPTNLTAIGGQDIFLAKYDLNGVFLWAKQAGGAGAVDASVNICVDSSNNVYIIGEFQLATTFDTVTLTAVGSASFGNVNNCFWAEYASDGSLVQAIQSKWQTQTGGGGAGGGGGDAITTDSNGNVFITGEFIGWDGTPSLTVSKWNSSGQTIWQTQIAETSGVQGAMGGRCLALDSAGDIYLAGIVSNPITLAGATFGANMFIAELDPDGNYIWAKPLGNGDPQSLAFEPDNSLLIAGNFADQITLGTNTFGQQFSGIGNGFVAESDPNGNILTAWQIPTNGSSANGAVLDSNGNIYVTGYMNPFQVFLDKYEEHGNQIWSLQPAYQDSTKTSGLALAMGPSNRICILSTATGGISFDNAVFTNAANNDLYLSVAAEDAPPAFVTQPSPPLGLTIGSSGSMNVTVRSLFPVSLQWQFNGTNLPDATNNSLVLTNAQLFDEGPYRIIASNLYGANTSSVASVSIYYVVTVISNGGPYRLNPFGYNIPNGLLTYSNHSEVQVVPQMFLSNFTGPFVNWTGDFSSTTNSLTLTVTSNIYLVANFADATTNITIDNLDRRASFQGPWSLVTSPPCYFENSAQALCSTNATATATFTPDIIVPGYYDVSAWFAESYVAYDPNGEVDYDSTNVPWTIVGDQGSMTIFENARNLAGEHVLATGVHFAAGTNGYITVSNGTGESSPDFVPVDAVTLTLSQLGLAKIIPGASTAAAGALIQFNTTLSGTLPVSYQWQLNGTNIPGATQSYLEIYPTLLADAGTYTVAVSNIAGVHVSKPAVLTVTPPLAPSLDSISLDASNELELSISANSGLTLTIQTSSNLTDWATLTNIFNLGGTVSFTDTNSPGTQSRFYRVLWTPQ